MVQKLFNIVSVTDRHTDTQTHRHTDTQTHRISATPIRTGENF